LYKLHYLFFIIILDVPSSPRNLEVSDIFKTSCKIKWESSEDNGGAPILHYIVERQDLTVKGMFLYYLVMCIYLICIFHLLR